MTVRIKNVTITGADDSTDIRQLAALSAEFPFVEWGILVSSRQEGNYRFPSKKWIERFASVATVEKINISTHVCGIWMREMLTGILDWRDLSMCVDVSQRVQINTHAESHVSTTGLMESLATHKKKQFIFQWDGVNNHLAYAALAYGLDVAVLFDTSGGAGILPAEWPKAIVQFPCGYAGGLGPMNVLEQIDKIATACPQPFWIDMERRVRTKDDSALDLVKVRQVLTLVESRLAGNLIQ